MAEKKYNEASEQAWPSFVDILSSTVLVLCFALLILVIVLNVTRITSSTRKESDESSPSSFKIESDILGDYRQEFQKLAIVANPSQVEEMEVQSEQPTTVEVTTEPYYVPTDAVPTESPQKVEKVGQSRNQVIGDIPKTIDSKSVVVLKELIITQRDVIEQQRKVIEQQDENIQQTIKEYQSLLALITKETNEVEDIRQKIIPREDQATFAIPDRDGELLTGPSETPRGLSNYVLNPEEDPRASVKIVPGASNLRTFFEDNADFLREDNYEAVKTALEAKITDFRTKGVVIEAMAGQNSLSGAQDQRIAASRLLIYRSILLELGVPRDLVKIKIVKPTSTSPSANSNKEVAIDNEESGYGWINVKAND